MAVPDLRDPDKEPWDSERMKNLLSITNPVGGRKSFKSRHFWAQILCPFWYVVAAASEMQDTLWKHIVLPTCNVTCAGEWWLCLFPQLHRAKGPVLIASSLQSSALCTVGTYLMLVELASQWVDCYQTAGHATVHLLLDHGWTALWNLLPSIEEVGWWVLWQQIKMSDQNQAWFIAENWGHSRESTALESKGLEFTFQLHC